MSKEDKKMGLTKKKYQIPIERPIGKKIKKKKTGKRKSNHRHKYEYALSYDKGITAESYDWDSGIMFTYRSSRGFHAVLHTKPIYGVKRCTICGFIKDSMWMVGIDDPKFVNAVELDDGIKKEVRAAYETVHKRTSDSSNST